MLASSPGSGGKKNLYSFYFLILYPLTSSLSLFWSGSLLGFAFQLIYFISTSIYSFEFVCYLFKSSLTTRISCSLSHWQVKLLILSSCLSSFLPLKCLGCSVVKPAVVITHLSILVYLNYFYHFIYNCDIRLIFMLCCILLCVAVRSY